MKPTSWLPILTALAVAAPGALGWGAVGHEIVATIAQMHLHPAVLPTICDILNFTSTNPNEPLCHLAPISTWADKLRFRMRWSASLHYVGAVADHPSQLCLFPGAKGWEKDANVLTGIRNTTNLLGDWVEAEKSGAGGDHDMANEALKFLVHFLGDLHQPLHLTGRDRGGNGDKVLFGGRSTNLHSLWDSLLISKSLRTIPQNYTKPLPSAAIEYNLRQTIYDPYIRRIMWQGVMGEWKDELQEWLDCPATSTSASDLDASLPFLPQSAISLWNWLRGTSVPQKTDDDAVCPFAWAAPIHTLNCDIVWPKALDEEPYRRTRFDAVPHGHAKTPEEDVAMLDRAPVEADASMYLELDTPEYSGVIHDQWIIEKLLAQGGIRLAAVLNYLFAPLEDGGYRAMTIMKVY
ncbi:phospholipase C/P1 nuclease [Hymenopellis radicata]|nr:phospholipase C/P1 nuclease [Hymenopellis radicata]